MATLQSVFVPTSKKPTKIAALAATTASATQTFANNAIIAITASGNCQVVFGNAGPNMPTADNTGWLIASGAVAEFDLGQWDSVQIFNPTAGNIDVYILQIGRG